MAPASAGPIARATLYAMAPSAMARGSSSRDTSSLTLADCAGWKNVKLAPTTNVSSSSNTGLIRSASVATPRIAVAADRMIMLIDNELAAVHQVGHRARDQADNQRRRRAGRLHQRDHQHRRRQRRHHPRRDRRLHHVPERRGDRSEVEHPELRVPERRRLELARQMRGNEGRYVLVHPASLAGNSGTGHVLE